MACQVVEGGPKAQRLGALETAPSPIRRLLPVNEDVNQPVNRLNTIGGPNE